MFPISSFTLNSRKLYAQVTQPNKKTVGDAALGGLVLDCHDIFN